MVSDERRIQERETFLRKCEGLRIKLLWEILFETDVEEIELLEERIYQYGSMLKEQDYLGRDIFLCMIALLHQLKNE